MVTASPNDLILKRTTIRRWNGKQFEVEQVIEHIPPAEDATTPQTETAPPAEDEEIGFGDWRPEESKDDKQS